MRIHLLLLIFTTAAVASLSGCTTLAKDEAPKNEYATFEGLLSSTVFRERQAEDVSIARR